MQKYPNDIMSDHGLHVDIIILSDGHYECEKKRKKLGKHFLGGQNRLPLIFLDVIVRA